MSTFLGLFSLLAFAGLVGYMALERYFGLNDAEPVATSNANERRAKLLERLDVEISAQKAPAAPSNVRHGLAGTDSLRILFLHALAAIDQECANAGQRRADSDSNGQPKRRAGSF
jgi:hypothetical protein